jgi:hypothetical protein
MGGSRPVQSVKTIISAHSGKAEPDALVGTESALFLSFAETKSRLKRYSEGRGNLANPQHIGKRTRQPRSSVVSSAAAGASWVALLAATSLGAVSVERMRAEVSAHDLAAATSAGYRLIVQSYSRSSVAADQLPGPSHRPLASAQRAVTAEELAHGVAVDMLRIDQTKGGEQVIVAWVEHGAPDLEFDALRARPGRSAIVGVAQASDGSAQIVLRRQRA